MSVNILCPHCRTINSSVSGLCYHCGKEIPDYLKEGTVECPSCLEITSAVEETCRHCEKPIPDYLLPHKRKELEKRAAQERADAAKVKALPPDKAQPASQQSDVGVVEKEPEAKVEAPAITAKVRPPRPADTSMKMLLRRNQKSGMMGMGRVTFALDVRVQVSTEMLALVKKYKMGKEILYYKEKVDLSDYWLLGPFRQFVKIIAARIWNVKITIDDLVKGKHMECKDIREMRAAEAQIREACETFKEVLESAAHFGGEEVIEI